MLAALNAGGDDRRPESGGPPFYKRWILRGLSLFNSAFYIPLAKWCASDLPCVQETKKAFGTEYTEPLASINPLVLLACVQDHQKHLEADPKNCQATLNSCLESVRHEQIGGTFLAMFGGLVASGYDPSEALCRVLANAIMLGMHLERRLKS